MSSIPINIETLLSGKVLEGSTVFDTDEPDRRYFVTEIKIHHDFVIDDANPDEGSSRLVEGLVEKEIGGSIEENGSTIDKKGGTIGGTIKLTQRQKEIVSIIEENNKISSRELSEKLRINHSAVQKHLNTLKRKGIILRIGGTRGYWQINQPIINEQ